MLVKCEGVSDSYEMLRVCSQLLVAMDGIRPISVPWPRCQGRSTILPPSAVIQSGACHGSSVLASKLKVNELC